MARFAFGGGLSDWTFTVGDEVVVGALTGRAVVAVGEVDVTFWSAETGGSQYSDLRDTDGQPIVSVLSEDGNGVRAVGQIPPFVGPDDVKKMWAQAADGPRALMVTTDAADATGDVGTILPPLSVSGLIAVGAGQHRLYNDTTVTLTIAALRASLGTPGTTDTVLDLNRNGSTGFPTQADRPTIPSGQNTSGRIVPTDLMQLAPGDFVTVDIDVAGNGARDLVVQLLAMRG